jgi:hypothetical protein
MARRLPHYLQILFAYQEVSMKKLNLIPLVLMSLSVGLFLAGCQNHRAGGTGSAKMSNSDLEDNIKTKLNSDPDLRAADLKVDADVDNNEVKISGKVASENLRNRAIDMVRSSHAGLVVTDKIDVEPRELSRTDNGAGTGTDTTMPNSNDPNMRDRQQDQTARPKR